jgi:hypothetical protein
VKRSVCDACRKIRLGPSGQAIVPWTCSICKTESCRGYPLPAICLDCSVKHGRCVKCAAEIEVT